MSKYTIDITFEIDDTYEDSAAFEAEMVQALNNNEAEQVNVVVGILEFSTRVVGVGPRHKKES